MKFALLSKRNKRSLQEGLNTIDTFIKNEEYLEAIKGIMGLMELFEEDIEFHKDLYDFRDRVKDLWKEKLNKNKV